MMSNSTAIVAAIGIACFAFCTFALIDNPCPESVAGFAITACAWTMFICGEIRSRRLAKEIEAEKDGDRKT